jgi:uncharacterized protein
MQFDLRQLARSGGEDHLDRTFQPEQFDPSVVQDEEYTVVAPVHLVMDVRKDRDAYRVTGRVETRLRLECGRCLDPFEIPVDSAFELRYVPEPSHSAADAGKDAPGRRGHADEHEREIAEDDITTAFYQNDALDLGELMHEQFVLALPMKPLCSDACRGLCPACGTNLNKGTCDCKPSWTDPRLAALQGILDRSTKES